MVDINPRPILPICCFPFGVLTVEFSSGGSLLSVEPFAAQQLSGCHSGCTSCCCRGQRSHIRSFLFFFINAQPSLFLARCFPCNHRCPKPPWSPNHCWLQWLQELLNNQLQSDPHFRLSSKNLYSTLMSTKTIMVLMETIQIAFLFSYGFEF